MADPGNTTSSVLQWILIVFAAGFIGYFGRYLSMQIIERIHKGKKLNSGKHDYKLEKKRIKSEKKRAKKN